MSTRSPVETPTRCARGVLSQAGPKADDLPEVFAGADGRAWADVLTDSFRLDDGASGILAARGTAIILDDYVTQPVGNAGAPIACGVIVPTTQP